MTKIAGVRTFRDKAHEVDGQAPDDGHSPQFGLLGHQAQAELEGVLIASAVETDFEALLQGVDGDVERQLFAAVEL